MKSSGLIILAILLTTAILAPSIVTLSNLDDKTAIAIDFNEEEKKEVNGKDFFVDPYFHDLRPQVGEKTSIDCFYIERNYRTSLSVFTQPPRTT